MATSALRLRNTLRTISGIHRSFSSPSFSVPTRPAAVSSTPRSPTTLLPPHSRAFRSSSISLLSARSSPTSNNTDEIGPDTILFEGCDYNHWLIVMDFPKDNKPTPQQMVETYEQTCAKGLNISLEEAKKKMYACSTTTYTGFQAIMTEEESEKFNGLPGVIFVLPDSYIDPVNKEYGGDKYINGTIIPRPPPIQYGRNQGRREQRSRNPDPPRYNQQGNQMSNPPGNQMSNPPGNQPYNNQGSIQGDGRNYGVPQNYPPRQNYGPGSQNYPQQQSYGPPSQSHQYAPQQQYGPASSQAPRQQYGPSSPQHAPQQNFGPPGQGAGRDPLPRHGGTGGYQGQRQTFVPSYMENFKPSYMEEFEQRFPSSGPGNLTRDNRNYGPPQSGNYGQGMGHQSAAGVNDQGAHPAYEQNFSGQGEGQRFAQGEQRNSQGEQRNYPPLGQTGTEQGRY